MTRYLLSVHSREGEVREPMTEEQMRRSHARLGEVEREVATAGAWVFSGRLAEDVVQEAFALALRKWPQEGLPPNPGGWITTTARNRALDRLRRDARGRELLGDMAVLATQDDLGEADVVADDRLRLIFTCCHPALSTEAPLALTLRLPGCLSPT